MRGEQSSHPAHIPGAFQFHDIFKFLGWVTRDEGFSRHCLCPVLGLRFSTVLCYCYKSNNALADGLQTESSLIDTGFHHSLIHFLSHSFIHSTNIPRMSTMCQAPCCVPEVERQRRHVPVLRVPGLGGAVRCQQSGVPSTGSP